MSEGSAHRVIIALLPPKRVFSIAAILWVLSVSLRILGLMPRSVGVSFELLVDSYFFIFVFHFYDNLVYFVNFGKQSSLFFFKFLKFIIVDLRLLGAILIILNMVFLLALVIWLRLNLRTFNLGNELMLLAMLLKAKEMSLVLLT